MSSKTPPSIYEVKFKHSKGVLQILGTQMEFLALGNEGEEFGSYIVLVIRQGTKTVYLTDASRIEEVYLVSSKVGGVTLCK